MNLKQIVADRIYPRILENAARKSLNETVANLLVSVGLQIASMMHRYGLVSFIVEEKFKQFVAGRIEIDRLERQLETNPPLEQIVDSVSDSPTTQESAENRLKRLRDGMAGAIKQPNTGSIKTELEPISPQELRYAASYAAYLHWHLIPINELIQDRLKRNLPLDKEFRDFAVFRLRGLAEHPIAAPESLVTLGQLSNVKDKDVATASREAIQAIELRLGLQPVSATIQWISGRKAVARF
ncbi:MAG TPA: hypothetical protein VGF13_14365, partial [Verrucomicrobiae bacterium]